MVRPLASVLGSWELRLWVSGGARMLEWDVCRVLRDVIPPTPPGPEGSNGNGSLRAQWVARYIFFARLAESAFARRRSREVVPVHILGRHIFPDI